MDLIEREHPQILAGMGVEYKTMACSIVAVQTRDAAVTSIQYLYYFSAYQRQWNGRQIIR